MNICYISNSAAPSKNASSLQTANLCSSLKSQGHKVKLILPDTGLRINYFKYYGIKKKFKIIRLKFFNKFPLGIYYYLFAIVSILKSDLRNQDIYITRNYLVSLVLVFLKKKHILEVHNDLEIEGRIIKFLVIKTSFLNSSQVLKIITTTKTLKKKFYEDYFVKSKKIYVLHNASSLKFKFQKTIKNKKKINLGYFGSIYLSRGVRLFLEISKNDKINNYYLYGGSNEEIQKIRKQYPNKNLILNPYRPYSQIQKSIKKIDIALLPYTSKITVAGNVGDISNYTSPLKIFDFMQAGKLILCSDINVIREILTNNHNSILIKKFKNLSTWINKISHISKSFKKYDKLRLNAYKYANKHNVDWRAKKILQFK